MKLNEYISTAPLVLDFPYTGEYVDEYLENMVHIDTRIKSKYGQLPLYYNNIEDITAMIQSTLFLNKYKYDGLYSTTTYVYDPFTDVDGTETTTIIYGGKETTNTIGDKETETNYASRLNSETESVFPYDTLEETTKNKKDTVTNPTSDKTLEKGRTDKTTTTPYEDKTILEKKGNFSVKSTQDLLKQEREVVNFAFWDIVIADVVKEITIPFYEG